MGGKSTVLLIELMEQRGMIPRTVDGQMRLEIHITDLIIKQTLLRKHDAVHTVNYGKIFQSFIRLEILQLE